jgi:hypothetical protein
MGVFSKKVRDGGQNLELRKGERQVTWRTRQQRGVKLTQGSTGKVEYRNDR